MNTKIAIQGYLYLLSFGTILGISGGMSPWLEFPLSPSISGFNSPFKLYGLNFPFTIGVLFIGTVISGTISILLKWRIVSSVLILLALFLLLYFPIYHLYVNPDWINTFLQEDKVMQSLERFIKSYYWPYSKQPPRFITGSEFEFLNDRFMMIFKLLGWGWFISLVGIIFLWRSSSLICRNNQKTILLKVNLLMLILCLLYFQIFDSISADNIHESADINMSSGQFRLAFDQYNKAIELDKSLQFSMPFLSKASKSLFLIKGEKHPWSQLYIISQSKGKRKTKKGQDSELTRFRKINLLIDLALRSKPKTLLEHSIYHALDDLKDDIWAEEGHMFYLQGKAENALQAYLNSTSPDRSDIRFFSAHAYKHLQQYNQAINGTLSVINNIDNSSVKSLLFCALGDIYQQAKKFDKARNAYFECLEYDSESNYHAAKNLSGS